MRINITSEVATLTDVVMADISVFHLTDPINVTQEKFYPNNPPILDRLLVEQKEFVKALEAEGVRIHWATSIVDCPFQHATRDIGVVVGNTFINCRMRKPIRTREKEGIRSILAKLDGTVVSVDNGFLEGGDVLVDGKTIYAGLSQRTDEAGLRLFSKLLGDGYKVVPFRMVEPFLHLDTVFNILPRETALVYYPAFAESPESILSDRYRVIKVSKEEQEMLATNLFATSPNTVIADKRNMRINSELRKRGIRLYELECSETTKIGRSFRCCTLPLIRVE